MFAVRIPSSSAGDTWCSSSIPSPRTLSYAIPSTRWRRTHAHDGRTRERASARRARIRGIFRVSSPNCCDLKIRNIWAKTKKAERLILAEIPSNSSVFLSPRPEQSLPPPLLDCPFGPAIRLPLLFLIKIELSFNYIIHGVFHHESWVFRYSRPN